MNRSAPRIALLLAIAVVPVANAYTLGLARWPIANTAFHPAFDADDPAAAAWREVFSEAAEAWNRQAPFRFDVTDQSADPCHLPSNGQYRNGVAFGDTRCGGAEFSPGTLAVTISWSIDGELLQSGIIFNARHHLWDVYDGPWRNTVADFKRVAVHELGHAAGLRHESHQPAIMAPVAGSLTTPQRDDVAGIEDLYDFGPLLGSSFEPQEQAKAAAAVSVDALQTLSADMDGDGVADTVQYRAIDGLWHWRASSTGQEHRIRFGGPGQQPVPGDFDGDGRAEPATWSADGYWQVWAGPARVQAARSAPASQARVSDLDGDGRDELVLESDLSNAVLRMGDLQPMRD